MVEWATTHELHTVVLRVLYGNTLNINSSWRKKQLRMHVKLWLFFLFLSDTKKMKPTFHGPLLTRYLLWVSAKWQNVHVNTHIDIQIYRETQTDIWKGDFFSHPIIHLSQIREHGRSHVGRSDSADLWPPMLSQACSLSLSAPCTWWTDKGPRPRPNITTCSLSVWAKLGSKGSL